MLCYKCGGVSQYDTAFCPYCGANLAQEGKNHPFYQNVNNNQNAIISGNSNATPNISMPIQATPAVQPNKRKSKIIITIVAIVFGVIALLSVATGLIYYFVNTANTDDSVYVTGYNDQKIVMGETLDDAIQKGAVLTSYNGEDESDTLANAIIEPKHTETVTVISGDDNSFNDLELTVMNTSEFDLCILDCEIVGIFISNDNARYNADNVNIFGIDPTMNLNEIEDRLKDIGCVKVNKEHIEENGLVKLNDYEYSVMDEKDIIAQVEGGYYIQVLQLDKLYIFVLDSQIWNATND